MAEGKAKKELSERFAHRNLAQPRRREGLDLEGSKKALVDRALGAWTDRKSVV